MLLFRMSQVQLYIKASLGVINLSNFATFTVSKFQVCILFHIINNEQLNEKTLAIVM